jgi:hypothetical protein
MDKAEIRTRLVAILNEVHTLIGQLSDDPVLENNARVLDKWKKGDNLATSTPEDQFYPPRGIFSREEGRMVSTYKAEIPKKPKRHLYVVSNEEDTSLSGC